MVRSSSLIAATLYLIYHASLALLNPWPLPVSIASQSQENLVKVQGFVYDSPNAECVIVGSSLAARLDMRPLPACQNIALGGYGSIDGLTILNRLQLRPKLLLIESNHLLINDPNTQWIDILLAPGIYELRRFFPGLLARNRPINLVTPVVNKLQFELTKLLGGGQRNARIGDAPAPNPEQPVQEVRVSDELFAELLRYQQTAHRTLPEPADIERRIALLETYIEPMRASGVRVIFVEIPTHPTLFPSPHYTFTRSIVTDRFAPDDYPFFQIDPTAQAFTTTDGIHLDVAGATRFSTLLAEWTSHATPLTP